MKSSSFPLEPGIVPFFRGFVGVRVVLVIISGVSHLLRGGNLSNWLYWVSLTEATLLMVYLSLPTLQKALGDKYLPTGIIWATLGPISIVHLVFWFDRASMTESVAIVSAWQSVILLFIPLVVIAAQYRFRHVILFCVFTTLIDLTPFFPLRMYGRSLTSVFPIVGIIMVRTITLLFVGNMIVNLMKVQRQQREALTRANQRLAHHALAMEELALSRERNRLAREMHDVLAHTLSSVAVELEAVKALWSVDPGRAQNMLDHSLSATREGLTETRRALQELRAAPLEDLGLSMAVRSLAEATGARSGLTLDLHVEDNLGEVPGAVQQCLYRVTQEALANIAQHAAAGCVRVDLRREGSLLRLEIGDDGHGFDPAVIDDEQQFGLLGMRERVEMIGGTITIDSGPGQGTRICLSVPGEA